MRIAHRMYMAVIPAFLGVFVVAGLAYWGQFAHRVPSLVVIVAACAAIGTLIFSWLNARYVALRVERLAGGTSAGNPSTRLRMSASVLAPGLSGDPADELDTIESVVDRLSSAVVFAESGRARLEREAGERAHDYAALMATVAADLAKRIEEIRLPLHILLENRFGELNENQEEMLGAARTSADAADAEVIAMQQLADLDRGARTLRRDRILPGDLLKSLLPTLQAQAEKQGATLHVDIEPLVPAIWGDQPQLQEALSTLLSDVIARAAGTEIELCLRKTQSECEVSVRGAGAIPRTVRTALALHLVGVMGGRVEREPDALRIVLCGKADK